MAVNRSRWPRGLRPLACWDCGFESRRGGCGCLSLVRVVFCQVDVSARGRSLVQRSRTECCVSECDRGTLTVRWPRPTGAVERLRRWLSRSSTSFSPECEFRSLLYSSLDCLLLPYQRIYYQLRLPFYFAHITFLCILAVNLVSVTALFALVLTS